MREIKDAIGVGERIMRQEIRQKIGDFLSYFVEWRQFLVSGVYYIRE